MEKTFIVTVWEKEHWVVARCSEVDVTGQGLPGRKP